LSRASSTYISFLIRVWASVHQIAFPDTEIGWKGALHRRNHKESASKTEQISLHKRTLRGSSWICNKTCMSWEAQSGAWLQSRENQISASAWSIKIIVVSSCCSSHTRSVHVQERIHFEREREWERGNRLALRAFSSLPTISEIMGLEMGIPVRARNSCTLFQIAFLRHPSFFPTITAAVRLYTSCYSRKYFTKKAKAIRLRNFKVQLRNFKVFCRRFPN